MSLYERLFPRFRPRRELRPQGSGEGWSIRIAWLGTAGFIVETKKICVPSKDARGAVLAS